MNYAGNAFTSKRPTKWTNATHICTVFVYIWIQRVFEVWSENLSKKI